MEVVVARSIACSSMSGVRSNIQLIDAKPNPALAEKAKKLAFFAGEGTYFFRNDYYLASSALFYYIT